MLIPAFISKMIIGKVISITLDRLSQFSHEIDWDLVRNDLEVYVRKYTPFEIFDDLAVGLANSALNQVRLALNGTETLGKVLNLLANQEFTQAAQVLSDAVVEYLSDSATPQSMASLDMKAQFEDFAA